MHFYFFKQSLGHVCKQNDSSLKASIAYAKLQGIHYFYAGFFEGIRKFEGIRNRE